MRNPIRPIDEFTSKPFDFRKRPYGKIAVEYPYVTVRLRGTDILTINLDNRTVTLDSGGWSTKTTKKWMNEVMEMCSVPWRVYQHKNIWYVYNSITDENVRFYDGIELPY